MVDATDRVPFFDRDDDDSRVPLLVTATEAVPPNDCDDSKVTLVEFATEAVPLFDCDGSRVALVGAIKEAVRLLDCDEDSGDRFPLDEIYPVLIGRREELNTIGGPEEGEEIAPDKGTMSDAAQRRC